MHVQTKINEALFYNFKPTSIRYTLYNQRRVKRSLLNKPGSNNRKKLRKKDTHLPVWCVVWKMVNYSFEIAMVINLILKLILFAFWEKIFCHNAAAHLRSFFSYLFKADGVTQRKLLHQETIIGEKICDDYDPRARLYHLIKGQGK